MSFQWRSAVELSSPRSGRLGLSPGHSHGAALDPSWRHHQQQTPETSRASTTKVASNAQNGRLGATSMAHLTAYRRAQIGDYSHVP